MTEYDIQIQISAETEEENYHEYLDWLDSEKEELNDIMKLKHLMNVIEEPWNMSRQELIDLDVEMDFEKSESKGGEYE